MALTKQEHRQALASLQGVGFLRQLPDDQLELLVAGMEKLELRPGTPVVNQGDHGDAFYIIGSGSVNVYRRSFIWTKHVELMRPPGFFGELALLYDTPRTATVVGDEPGWCYVLTRDTFNRILLAHPPIAELIRRVAGPRFAEASHPPDESGPA